MFPPVRPLLLGSPRRASARLLAGKPASAGDSPETYKEERVRRAGGRLRAPRQIRRAGWIRALVRLSLHLGRVRFRLRVCFGGGVVLAVPTERTEPLAKFP